MDNSYDLLSLHSQLLVEDDDKQEVRECNAFSKRFGLSLSEEEIQRLMECRAIALQNTGRIEFAGGILPKLIYAFCDSPYIDEDTYESTLVELQEAFYYFKSESMEQFTDDELIDYMKKVFHGRAHGVAEYLIGLSLETLCRYAQGEFDPMDADEAGDLF